MGAAPGSPSDPLKPQDAYQALDCVMSHREPFALKLPPGLAYAVDLEALVLARAVIEECRRELIDAVEKLAEMRPVTLLRRVVG